MKLYEYQSQLSDNFFSFLYLAQNVVCLFACSGIQIEISEIEENGAFQFVV